MLLRGGGRLNEQRGSQPSGSTSTLKHLLLRREGGEEEKKNRVAGADPSLIPLFLYISIRVDVKVLRGAVFCNLCHIIVKFMSDLWL